MSDKQEQRRKRSRWGAREQQQPVAVSDQDAMQALLSSAKAHQDERQQRQAENAKETSERPPFKKRKDSGKKEDAGYYGPTGGATAASKPADASSDDDEAAEKQKPNFGLSGTLTADSSNGGNVYKGVVLKFQEPPEARAPNTFWRLYVFKGEKELDTLHISKQSAYLIGRNEDIADICVQHASCSSQHAVIQYRALPGKDGRLNCQPYLMDLESTNGTFLNGVRIDAARYYQLKKGDVIKFGASAREYVLLTANTKSIE